ncbi:MAG: dihydrolipoyl dehydrogenase [Acidimicrobiales bacterium]|nr:MAG: dihydrolipoyl dehydrogenase [Acidimicrobiales bacterium]
MNEVIPTAEQFDLVVVGGGPGGYAAALYGASAGLSVAVVEQDKVGGTCLHRGCVPAKQFLETATVLRTVAGAKEFGIQASQPSVDFAVSQARKRKVVDQLWRGLVGLMRRRQITTVEGSGFLGPDRVVRVGATGQELRGGHVVLATGSVPMTLPGFEVEGQVVMTSDELLDLEVLPGSVVVVGGGAVGCEFASMLADLGTQVTLLEALPKLLPGCDREVVDVVTRSFNKRGIVVRTGAAVRGHAPNGTGTVVSFGDDEQVTTDAVVVCVGRRPRSAGVVADGLGVEIDGRGHVVVDERMRTGADGVYAVGDLVAGPQLAHVGFAEAMVAVRDILGEPAMPVDYQKVPWCIYTHPEVAFAGLSEEAAQAAGYDLVVKRDPFGGNSRARIVGDTEGLVKVIAERGSDGAAGRLLGVHMAGPWVTEQLGAGYLALNWEAEPTDVAHFLQPHPTLSEAFGETVLALTGRGLHVG